MNIDNTNLLDALKRDPVGVSPSTKSSREAGGYAGCVIPNAPHSDIPDAEKIEAYPPKVEDLSREAGAMRVANELHEWLANTGKEQTR